MEWKDILLFSVKKVLRRLNKRVGLKLLFEVEPAIYSDCPHFNSLAHAENQAREEDEMDEKWGRKAFPWRRR